MQNSLSRFIDLQGHRFHYLDFGGDDLPPLIFLHGTGLHAWMWEPLGRGLKDRYRVYSLDQRGHGDSTKTTDDYNWSSFGDDLGRFIDALGLDKPYAVGHSMGGTTIALCEGRRPGTLSKALLIDPIICTEEYYGDHFTLENDSMSARTLRRRDVWDSHAQMIEAYRDRDTFMTWTEEMVRLYVEGGAEILPDGQVRLKCPPKNEAEVFLGGHFTDPWPYLPKVEIPVLILGAGEGNSKDYVAAERAAQVLPNATCERIAGTTHFMPMEKPEMLAERIAAFGAAHSAVVKNSR